MGLKENFCHFGHSSDTWWLKKLGEAFFSSPLVTLQTCAISLKSNKVKGTKVGLNRIVEKKNNNKKNMKKTKSVNWLNFELPYLRNGKS